ncbi:MAG: SDR family oxidoreductase [Deltaproteobacteria bacterium]|nr:SDR family oxidoreductase [Deltaproteobacteria bacterium]MBW2445782.1 SDR family oxidoreductase [Deltaproteobacteria bacterium]
MSPSNSLSGRVALVTGVSRRIGIGAAVAARLLDDGARVVTTGFEPHDEEMPWETDAGGAAAALEEHPAADRWHALPPADFADPATSDRVVAATIERFGAVDILVANHARSSHQGFAEATVEELDACWAINARSVILLAQSLAERRPPGPGGRLVYFTSGQHIGPMPNEIAYAVSKGALHQMTATLADALIDRGVTVNCINPGPTDTGYAKGRSHEVIARMFPAGRWGRTEDVANLVAWLVSAQGEWMTGQVHVSEGGFRRWARPKVER